MGHPVVENLTPFAYESLFLTDEEGRDVIVPVLKATYTIADDGLLIASEEQLPVTFSGVRWHDSDQSSFKFEPEIALAKPAVDVACIASARPRHGRSREVDVILRFGRLEKSLRVTGDRTWVKRLGGRIAASDPQPFESMPITWERAYGGWDRSAPDPAQHTGEPRNPIGVGFRAKRASFEEGIALPNVEDPRDPQRSFGDPVTPAGLGFVGPNWQPRASHAGTYDDAWVATRMPLLPADFDRRFFNAAAPGLTLAGPVRGGEPVTLTNTVPRGEIHFKIPRVPPPTFSLSIRRRPDCEMPGQLDTIVVDTDDLHLVLLWRGAPVPTLPQDVHRIGIAIDGVPIQSR